MHEITKEDTAYSISAVRRKRFLEARAVLRKITDILVREYDVGKIILIGSLSDSDRFGFHSDIDICVEGLSDRAYFKAAGELLLEAGDFDIDIIPLENASPEMTEKIKKGKVLYEKR